MTAPSYLLADNFALVVGIDEYDAQPNLAGAVNDARWIAESLNGFGVSELSLLLNQDATRANIERSYYAYLDQARRGDTIIFTFAGHGRYVPDLNGDEASISDPNDRQDETLVMGGFSFQNPGEEIIDDELNLWFADADAKGVNVLFLSDSCHSGTVTRGGRARFIDEFGSSIPALKRPITLSATVPQTNYDTLTFLAGASELQVVTEVVINGRNHGALSFAFGQALRGMRADGNSDGAISRDELAGQIRRAARAHNDGRGLPDMVARGGPDFPLLVPDNDAQESDIVSGQVDGWLEPVVPIQDGSGRYKALAARPDLKWDQQTGDITSQDGEIVASGVARHQLRDVNAKFEMLEMFRHGLSFESFDTFLDIPGHLNPELLRMGDRFTIEVGPIPYPFVTIFNLANNGEVQLIYPINASERAPQPTNTTLRFDVKATPPAGIDHLIAVSSQVRPDTLRKLLDYGSEASDFVQTAARITSVEGHAFGIVSMATTDR